MSALWFILGGVAGGVGTWWLGQRGVLEEGLEESVILHRPPMPREVSERRPRGDREAGARWFNGLAVHDKWELGDQFVLGTFDWRDWFESPPSQAFLRGADEARMNWEATRA